jgi:hypothetical protein
MMGNKLVDDLRRVLRGAGVYDSPCCGFDWWTEQEEGYNAPSIQMALFLRESWKCISEDNPQAISSLLTGLRSRAHDDETYLSKWLREGHGFSPLLDDAISQPELGEAIAYLVRAAQIEAMGSLMTLIDGGERFSDGLASSWSLAETSEDGDLSRPFGNLAELFWCFDPKQRP